jgi:cytochrome oxidase Cu insertion factor (SCO1/SenC/PrrC family)
MLKKIGIVILTILLTANHNYAQVKKETVTTENTNPLKGLRKADFKDLDQSKPLMLDGFSTPVYSENLELLKGEAFMKVMSTGDMIPDVFVDSNNDVKAFVLRKATDLEKSRMIKMQDDVMSKKDMVGKLASPFSVTDINGNKYSLESLKGKVIVINFWFVECKPCVMEMPELNKIVEKFKNKDVVFLGFAINEKDKIEKFLKTTSYKYNVVPSAQQAIQSYGVNSFPTHIVIDKNSNISFSTSGLGDTTIEDLEKEIGMVLE